MFDSDSPAAVVQRQLDAYNARDVDALLAALPEVHRRALRAGLSGAAPV